MKKRNTIKKNISILLAFTLLCMVIAGSCSSNGLMLNKSKTFMQIPSFFRRAAASKASYTSIPQAKTPRQVWAGRADGLADGALQPYGRYDCG